MSQSRKHSAGGVRYYAVAIAREDQKNESRMDPVIFRFICDNIYLRYDMNTYRYWLPRTATCMYR